MDPRLQAQLGVRQQAEELHEYMKDLFGWQKEMKAKEKGLAKQAGPGSSSAPLPPVRGRAAGGAPPAAVAAPPTAPAVRPAPEPSATSPERAAEAEPPGGQARHPAAHTYDHYRDKWDKFDVDAALASDEEEGRGAAASSGGGGRQTAAAMAAAAAPPAQQQLLQQPAGGGRPGAAPLPAARLRTAAQAAAARPPQPTTADGWREEGNRHFKAGAFQQAADCYTASLELAPTCLAHANRAMALLKMGRQAEAEADCTAALGLDPSYVKAYQRRATARREVGDLPGAIEDFEAALRWEPTNKAAAAERWQCIAALLEQQGLVWEERRERLPVTLAAAAPAALTPASAAAAAGAVPAAQQAVAAPPAAASEAQQPVVAQAAASSQRLDAPPQAAAAAAAPACAEQPPTGSELGGGAAAAALPPAGIALGAGSPSGAPAGVQPMAVDLEGEETLPPLAQQAQQVQQAHHSEAAGRPASSAEAVVGAAPILGGAVARPGAPLAATPAASSTAQGTAGAAGTSSNGVAPQAAAAVPEAAAGGAAVATTMAGALKHVGPTAALKPPRSGIEFEKAWKGFKGDLAQQWAYLELLPPAKLPAVMKQALTPALLAALLRTLLGPGVHNAPGQAAALLEALPDVPRFDMNLLSLPSKEKGALGEAWSQAQAALEGPQGPLEAAARLAALRLRYKL